MHDPTPDNSLSIKELQKHPACVNFKIRVSISLNFHRISNIFGSAITKIWGWLPMARKLRIQLEGGVYHVISRGTNREDIFKDDRDRLRFFDILNYTVKKHNWIIYSYCLMNNHYHLLIETPEANLSRGMHLLNSVYCRKFNMRHGRVGTLLQDRFRSLLVTKQSYLLELTRYIVLNPVRAQFVQKPHEWTWSSYRATVGLEEPPPFLRTELLLKFFSKDRARAREHFKAFVLKGLENYLEYLKHNKENGDGYNWGINKLEKIHKQIASETSSKRPTLNQIFRKVIEKGIIEAVYKWGYTHTEIGKHLGLHRATISRRASNGKKNIVKVELLTSPENMKN